jgi:hypothetical protein
MIKGPAVLRLRSLAFHLLLSLTSVVVKVPVEPAVGDAVMWCASESMSPCEARSFECRVKCSFKTLINKFPSTHIKGRMTQHLEQYPLQQFCESNGTSSTVRKYRYVRET